jgi:hypothetical protein
MERARAIGLEHVQFAKSIHPVKNRMTTIDCCTGCDAMAAAYNNVVQFSEVKIWYIPKNAL